MIVDEVPDNIGVEILAGVENDGPIEDVIEKNLVKVEQSPKKSTLTDTKKADPPVSAEDSFLSDLFDSTVPKLTLNPGNPKPKQADISPEKQPQVKNPKTVDSDDDLMRLIQAKKEELFQQKEETQSRTKESKISTNIS